MGTQAGGLEDGRGTRAILKPGEGEPTTGRRPESLRYSQRHLDPAWERALADRAQVPPDIVARLRSICLALPAAYEESAWAGTRWKIGRHNFAHVVAIDAGWPPAYARAAGSGGPLVVVTFRVPESKLGTTRFTRRPYFKPVWWPDIAGMAIDADTDWDDVGTRLTDSYRALAPKRLLKSNDDESR